MTPRRNLNAVQPAVRAAGRRAKRHCIPPEHIEAVVLLKAVRAAEPKHPELAYFAAVPNGGHRSKPAAGKAKAEGVRRGVPDYLWPLRRGEHVGLALELKRSDGGQTSPEQRRWHAWLRAQGWRVVVARGWEAAWAAVLDYLASDADNPEDD